MVRFTSARRELLAEKSADLANFAVAGMAIWVLFMAFALVLKGGSR
jgi:hypothetical protein